MKRKVQIEVTSPVQDPTSGEVLVQPGTRFDEGAAELEGLPSHMLRPVFVEDGGLSAEEKGTTPEGWTVDKDGDAAAAPTPKNTATAGQAAGLGKAGKTS